MTRKYGQYECAICQNSTTGMFLYWSFVTVKWVPNHRKVKTFHQI